MKIDVTRAGFLTSVQDLGRLGFRQFGVSVGGALDSHALRVANLLVGNDESAAGLEITLGGLRLRFVDDRIVAWCGGGFDVRLGSTSVAAGHAALVRAGQELMFNQPKVGCRCWLGISGEIDVPIVLGSRSTDLRTNFGGFDGRALRDGDTLPLGRNSERNDEAIQQLTNEGFSVTAEADRMGARLDGPELKRADNVPGPAAASSMDLISEAVVPGTIQVPPGGKPIVLLGDCQTIGGYPKIAHVISVDLPIAAQLRVGDRVRFHEVSLTEAHQLLAERERDLAEFRVGIKLHVR